MTPPGSPPRGHTLVALVILAGALLFSLAVRWRLREFPLERDEGGYAYTAQLMLEGVPLYKGVYSDKLPGLFLAYAAMMAPFGQTTAGIHLGLAAVNLATIVLIFLLVKDLFDPLAGAMAAASYSLMALGPSVLGTAAHATHIINLFGVAAVWGLWWALRRNNLPLLFLSGLLLGTAFLVKHQAAFLCGFGAMVVLRTTLCRVPSPGERFWPGAWFSASAESFPVRPRVSGYGVRAYLSSSGSEPSSMRGGSPSRSRSRKGSIFSGFVPGRL